MHLKPSENTNLYGMNSFFNEIINLYIKKKMPNKILLSGKKGLGKSTLAYHIINYILSSDENYKYDINNLKINKDNRSFKLLQNKSHPNFYLIDLIDEKKNIEVNQIREMIKFTNKSSFNNGPRFILLDNIENLNKNSVNALLKILEEPNDNIFFILVNNIEKNILPTLKSRCLTFKISFTFDKTLKVVNQLLNNNLFEIINHDLINYYTTPGEIINLINFSNEKKINLKEYTLTEILIFIIDSKDFKKNSLVKNLLIGLIELFFLKRYSLDINKNLLLEIYHNFLIRVYNTEKYNLDEESLFLEFKTKLLNG
jgi:DNA polymerase-3 subunit delta'